MKKISIGDVVVHGGMPPSNNPFRGCGHGGLSEKVTSINGAERVQALRAFKHGEPTGDYTFWDLRRGANALPDRQLKDPSFVDWTTSQIS